MKSMTHSSPGRLPDYYQITSCTESYFRRLGDCPLGMGWPNERDAVRRYDVMLDVIRSNCGDTPIRLLDFGCGTGHLYEHIVRQDNLNIEYHGVDLSEQFISAACQKHPGTDFRQLDVLAYPEALREYDYAVVNGVFTSKCQMPFEAMLQFVQNVLKLLFHRVSRGLAFNAMSKQVDWERDDLFHLPLDVIAQFLCQELSRNFVIRNDYGLYEYTTYVYHNPR